MMLRKILLLTPDIWQRMVAYRIAHGMSYSEQARRALSEWLASRGGMG
jgi:hypothetical protein